MIAPTCRVRCHWGAAGPMPALPGTR
jgi:hypothetical protein